MGFIFGSGKKAAEIQADATLQSAELQAASDREAARGSALTIQTQIAQERASDQAAELLNTPQEGPNVILSPEQDEPDIDPETNRRKTARSQFFNQRSSGLNI